MNGLNRSSRSTTGSHNASGWAFASVLVILLSTAWLYTPALRFGFIWDDPLWFGRVVEKPIQALLAPMPDFQFYRPGTMLYNRLFLRQDSTFSAPIMHAAQVGWHLLNVALVYALSRRLGVRRWTSVAATALVAWTPLGHQAVAWAAPQQPIVMALQGGAWLCYLQARQAKSRRGLALAFSLGLFGLALTLQESTMVLAGLPLLIEWALRGRAAFHTDRTGWRLALVYPLVALGYGLLWLQAPRQAGYTALAPEGGTLLYFLQGLLFPLWGRPAGYSPEAVVTPAGIGIASTLVFGGLLLLATYKGRLRQALFGLAWAGLGLAPPALGLRYDSYVSYAPRLLYYALPGIAFLWGCALVPHARRPAAPGRFRHLWHGVEVLALAAIAVQSLLLLGGFQRLYAAGARHLDDLTQAMLDRPGRALFVNFPDRYTPSRPPYPLGYWGVILAPVSVDLGAFPAISTGRSFATVSRSMPWVGADARERSPYVIDYRGVITPPEQLYDLARQADNVYLSRYLPDGTFELLWAGSAEPAPAQANGTCGLAAFGSTLCLQSAGVEPVPGGLSMVLTWYILPSAQAHDTVFVHLGQAGQPPVAQSDGDLWFGMLPLTVVQSGDVIREQRIIRLPLPLAPEISGGGNQIRVGVYNRVSGERYPATSPPGEPLPGDTFTLPDEF